MSDTKFTPGPWETSITPDGHNGLQWDVCEADAGDMIADITSDSRNAEEREANARLIAAAPDMYAALQKIDSNAAESADWIRMIARAALAKAEGR